MTNEEQWRAYVKVELQALTPLLSDLGYVLLSAQPHLHGERYHMRAVTTMSGAKLTLLAKNKEGQQVVIKATRDWAGTREIQYERRARKTLAEIDFAYHEFFSPEELLFVRKNGFTISVLAFIQQEKQFIDRPIEEQFAYALQGFKIQESAHATTYGHFKLARRVFGERTIHTYVSTTAEFVENSKKLLADTHVHALLDRAQESIRKSARVIDQYTGFLTHTDFVPHNFRIVRPDMYLLDHSSLTFGNKYESWARFTNFMTLYNPALARTLETYVKDNRTEEEVESFAAMRVYRLTEIIWYYIRSLRVVAGDLQTLNRARVDFWVAVLASLLEGQALDEKTRAAYMALRDSLRSPEERERQKGLH